MIPYYCKIFVDFEVDFLILHCNHSNSKWFLHLSRLIILRWPCSHLIIDWNNDLISCPFPIIIANQANIHHLFLFLILYSIYSLDHSHCLMVIIDFIIILNIINFIIIVFIVLTWNLNITVSNKFNRLLLVLLDKSWAQDHQVHRYLDHSPTREAFIVLINKDC